MAANFQQTNTNANASAEADLCSGNTSSTDNDSNQADVGGSAGSTERTHTPDNSAADLNGVWMEIGNAVDIDDYDGGAGNWETRLNITTGNHQLTLDEIHICRVNSSYVNQETLGSLTGIGANLSSTGVQSHTVNQASGTTIGAGDKIIIIYAFDNAQSMANSFGYTPDQIIDAPGSFPVPTLTQVAFRIRAGDTVGLNVDSGWEAAINIDATKNAEEVFRIRFVVGVTVAGFTGTFKLQSNRELAGWVDVAAPGTPETSDVPDVQYQDSGQYADNAATTELLAQAQTFVAGEGLENNPTGSLTIDNGEETEIEVCVLIRKLFGTGNGGFTSDGDTIDFRLVEGDSTALDVYTQTPTITVNHPTRLIGGVFTETPGFVGPVADDNGNLYALVEHATLPSPIIPSVLKSADGGDSWIPQDDDDWPTSSEELEAADLHHISADDIIYMGWTSSTDPAYREFRTSAHGTPDSFVADPFEVEAVGTVTEQVAAIVRRSDNTTVMFYNEIATDGKLRYKIRSSGGTWGAEQTCEGEAGIQWSSCKIVIGASDLIHIIYSGDAAADPIYYRNLNSSDTLSGRTSLTTDTDASNFAPFVKPVYWDDGGTEKIYLIYFKTTDNKLYSRIVTSGSVGSESASPITTNAVAMDIASSGTPTAQAVVDGTDVYVVYAHETDKDLYLTKSVNGGTFDTDTEILDAVTVDLLSASIFTHNAGNGSAKVLGVIYADNRFGAGNTGDVVYWENELAVINLKSISGAITFAGDSIKETQVNRAGAITFAGAISAIKMAFKSIAGVITFAGAISTSKKAFKSINGVITFVGTVSPLKTAFKVLSGAITFVGVQIKKTILGRSGAITFAGAISATKMAFKSISGAITFVGTVSPLKTAFKVLSGVITFAGAVIKKTSLVRVGAITFAGAVSTSKKAFKSVSGAITFAGTVSGSVRFIKAIGGAITFVGSAIKKTIISRIGEITFIGSAIKKTKVSRSGAITFNGVVTTIRSFSKAIGGAITFAGAAIKKTIITRIGEITFIGSAIKKIKVSRAGVITFAGALAAQKLVTQFTKAVSGAMTFAGSMRKKTKVKRGGAMSFVGGIATLLINLWRELTLRPRTATLTLEDRSVSFTLSARIISFTLPDL